MSEQRGLDGPSGAAWSGAGAELEPGAGAPLPSRFDHPEAERYQRGHLLGRGGMGRVTQVFDRRLGREVAMKEVVDGGHEHEARLLREAELTAALDHPGIVSVHDAGRTAEGSLYYTMPIVRGRSLAVAIKEAKGLDERLRLLRHVLNACEAVAFAHQRGIVHRDLKPANIMVGELGETQVLDWGLARALSETSANPEGRAQADPELTRVGQIVGTPRYMSPEQASGQPATTGSDVWSLGALLHEVCTGKPALQPSADSPPDSDAVLEAARAGRVLDVREAEPKTPPELAAIIARALARPASARYPDAKALAVDLEAYLDGRRVTAHEYTTWELVLRLMRAWRVPLLIGALALVATAVGLAIAFAEVDAERDRAVFAEDASTRAATAARRSEQEARAALAQADAALARTLVIEALSRAATGARPEAELLAARSLALADSPEARGVLLSQAVTARPELRVEVALPPKCVDADVASDLSELACREDGALALWALTPARSAASRGLALRWRRPVGEGLGVAILESAGLVLTADRMVTTLAFERATGTARPLRPPGCCPFPPYSNLLGNAVQQVGPRQLTVVTATAVHELEACIPAEELAGAVDPSGTRWAATCRDGSLLFGPLEATRETLTRVETPLAAPRAPASALAWTPDGRFVLGTTDGRVVVFDPASRRTLHDLAGDGAMVNRIEVSPDGRFAVVVCDRGGPRLLHLASGTWRGRLPDTTTRRVRFLRGSPADLVTLGDQGGHLRVWRLPADDGLPSALHTGGGVTSITASGDGQLLALTRGRGVELRAARDGALIASSGDLGGIVQGGAFDLPRGTYTASGGITRRVARWHLDGFVPFEDALDGPSAVRQVAALEAPERVGPAAPPFWVATLYMPGVSLWREGDPSAMHVGRAEDGPQMRDLAVTGDRQTALMLSIDGGVYSLEARAPELIHHFDHPGARALATGPAPDLVALAEGGGVSLRSLSDGAELAFLEAPDAPLITVALSADGRYAAAGDRAGRAYLWSLATRHLEAIFRGHQRRVSSLAFAQDGSWLATGSWDETVHFHTTALTTAPLADLERAWGLTLAEVLERL